MSRRARWCRSRPRSSRSSSTTTRTAPSWVRTCNVRPFRCCAVIELTGSRLDDWWDMLMRRRHAHAIWHWGGPLVVVIVASLLRLVGLAYPHELVFDETYYVKDAWTLMHLGYEGLWGADPNTAFN